MSHRPTSAVPPAVLNRRRTELVHRAAAADSVTGVFGEAGRRLRSLVPYDAAAWLMADPATGLPSAPSLLEDFSAPMTTCTEHWRREYLDTDLNRFPELARSTSPAAALRATAGDPERSTRFRWFVQPMGFADELRAVLRVGETPWAMVTLWRREDRPDFGPADTDLVGSLSEPLGDALRRLVREGFSARTAPAGEHPGVLTFDSGGQLIAVNDPVMAWLDELPRQELVPTPFGLSLPVWVLVTALRSRASLLDGGDGIARTRVRSRRGRWVVGQASTTRDAQGSPAGTVVVLEPASPALMAPVAVEAYGLTEREQEITRQVARGAGTAEIANSLFLSLHTVRDHVKSILNKVGVSSRGELVATLYTEQFEPAHFADIRVAEAG